MAEFQSIYTSLWGEPATEAYLKKAANAGLNRWEFEEIEMNKPAFRKTKTYKDKYSSFDDLVATVGAGLGADGGRRPRRKKKSGGGSGGGGNPDDRDPNVPSPHDLLDRGPKVPKPPTA